MVKLFTSQVKREKGKIQRTKTSSKVSKINTGLIEYIPKTLVKKTQKKPNMLILYSIVFSLYPCQSQTQYQIQTTIKYQK